MEETSTTTAGRRANSKPSIEPQMTLELDDGTVLHGLEADEAFTKQLAEQQRMRESLPPEAKEALAAAYSSLNEKIEHDPECVAEREASQVAHRAWRAALDAGASAAEARRAAQEACGRDDLMFDYSDRADELRRQAFAAHGFEVRRRSPQTRVGARRSGPSGRAPRAATNARRRGSRRTSSPSRAGPDEPAEGEPEPPRLCQFPGCSAPARRRYCSDKHAALARQWRHGRAAANWLFVFLDKLRRKKQRTKGSGGAARTTRKEESRP